MKVAIYGREFSSNTLPYVQQVFDCLMQFGIQPLVYENFSQFISGKVFFPTKLKTFNSYDTLKGHADVLISLGGDYSNKQVVVYDRHMGYTKLCHPVKHFLHCI